ncbi:hypothetical protein [Flexithrix dorotheae]|uniref:hypothetical protein n=1 Tax=Flexithrix dorotheae TaxID=70993 RepID=UPI00036BCBE8|nr:hypothetical protein [Flexithrix dorotheae]
MKDNAKQIKGEQLEKDFARFMNALPGYKVLGRRQFFKGTIAKRNYEIDIVAENYLFKIKRFYVIYLSLLAILLLLHSLSFIDLFGSAGVIFSKVIPEISFTGTILCLVIISLIPFLLRKYYPTLIFIESKNLSTKVKRDHMNKFINNVKDIVHKKGIKKSYRLVFVSYLGYDKDALQFARHHKVECWKGSGKKFHKIR